MDTQASPEFVIGQMRVQTMPELTFFYMVNEPTPITNLDNDLGIMIDKLEAAQREADQMGAGPIIIRYYPVQAAKGPDDPEQFLMEVGVPVKPGASPAGDAKVKTLPPWRCAGLLYWGSLGHILEVYGALNEGIRAAGLEPTGEGREWHYYFGGDNSPHNVIGLNLGIRP